MRILAAIVFAAFLACSPSPDAPAPAAEIEKVHLWEAGTDGYAHYRIPAIVCTREGSLLAFCEARKSPGGDWGAIDIMMRRSTDGGGTWDEPRVVARVEGEIQQNEVAFAQGLAKPGEVTYNNPAPIVDREIGAVHFLFCIEYARAYYMRSDDDGVSFSAPVDITPAFEEFRTDYDWKVIATGPGHGIQLSSGRLIVPVWMSDGTGGHAHRPSVVSTVYSDDHGATWHGGEIVAGETDPKNPSETLALELADGRVMLNMRNESPEHRRAIAYSPDGATNWTDPVFDDELVEPICMASLVRVSSEADGGRNTILFVNPDSTEPRNPDNPEGNFVRQNVTARLSYDEGETWPVKRSIEPGISGYSDSAVGPDGTIYVLYEAGSPSQRGTHVQYLTVARFGPDWVTAGE